MMASKLSSLHSISSLSICQLRTELRRRGAKRTQLAGRKEDLIERLEAYERNQNFTQEDDILPAGTLFGATRPTVGYGDIAEEIHKCLNSLSQSEALNRKDSLAVTILIHGVNDHLSGVDGQCITVSDASEHFTAERCPALHHKPINACRGENEDQGSLAPYFSLNQSAITSDHYEDIHANSTIPAVDSTNAPYSGVQESSSPTETNSSTLFGATHPTEGYSGNKAEEYRMESKPRGYFLIIDNRNFTSPLPDLEGSDVDCDSLEKLFLWLGYRVDICLNLTGEEIDNCLNSVSQFEALNRVDSLAVAILTHGVNDRLYGVDGQYITVCGAVEHFTAERCPALHHKPKLFIIEACRGVNKDQGLAPLFSLNQSAINLDHNEDIPSLSYVPGEDVRMSNFQDIILAHSTIPGYVSWRHAHKGSWFIQAFVKVFTNHAKKKDILTMLTKVNKILSEDKEKDGVQIPAPQFMLTKTWYLNPPPQREG